MANVYYDPEEFGLTPVADVDFGGGYDFDLIVVWKNSNNQLFWASDSGCSCPTPFEDVSFSDIIPVNLKVLRDAVNDHSYSSGYDVDLAHTFIDKVRREMQFVPLIEAIQELEEQEKNDFNNKI